MSTSKRPRVTRRRFLKETGLTLAAAGASPVFSAPFISSTMRLSILLATRNAIRLGILLLIRPVTTFACGRWVARIR